MLSKISFAIALASSKFVMVSYDLFRRHWVIPANSFFIAERWVGSVIIGMSRKFILQPNFFQSFVVSRTIWIVFGLRMKNIKSSWFNFLSVNWRNMSCNRRQTNSSCLLNFDSSRSLMVFQCSNAAMISFPSIMVISGMKDVRFTFFICHCCKDCCTIRNLSKSLPV